ncbi:helix-turn-helix domain-containing protein [Sphingobacterium suaedae]|uniref:Helix-turn-helix domain-containing protein n=1 Tax=Sphingobacterium suaedae TaxID=1686402 RepID=A0ABW5KDD2_9SPHI
MRYDHGSGLSVGDTKKGHMFVRRLENNVFYSFLQSSVKVERPQQATYFNVVLFEKGEGVVEIDGRSHTIGKGKVLVVFPGQWGACDLQSGTLAHHLMAKTEIYESISAISNLSVSKSSPISVFDLNETVFATLLYELLQIKEILETKIVGSDELVISRLKTIYLLLKTECMQVRDANLQDFKHPTLEKFVRLVDVHCKTDRSVAFYADHLHLQPNYLNILCKRMLKISAKQVIKNRLIIEAKNMLFASHKSVKQIAYELGIKSTSQFTTFFKRETGFLPTDFVKLRIRGVNDC